MKKKMFAVMTSGFMLAALPMSLPVCAAVKPNPVISRNCPAYSGTNPATAVAGNDDYYFSFWNGSAPDDYLAYDLSSVPEENRKIIDAVWYNASAYDTIGLYINRNQEPSDYTIEINSAEGGAYPENGWEIVETVSGNTLSSRQHIVNFEGYNWIRIHVTGVDDKTTGTCAFNFDIHDVSEGVNDSWIFYGDSITAGGMNNCFGTGFATYINRLDSNYFPIQENGGIGGITSTDGLNHIDRWLSVFPGKYVSIAYGTNDAWGNNAGAQKYYENTVAMIQKVLDAGKIPVLPKIPHAENPDVGNYLDDYNAMIDKIYEEFPQVIKGPDFNTIIQEHPEYLSNDGVHPNSEGYEEMRRIWAETMYQNVYTASSSKEDIKGDVNQDGVCSVTDIIQLQRYLIGKASLPNWKNADLVKDEVINIYDLIALKKLLLS